MHVALLLIGLGDCRDKLANRLGEAVEFHANTVRVLARFGFRLQILDFSLKQIGDTVNNAIQAL